MFDRLRGTLASLIAPPKQEIVVEKKATFSEPRTEPADISDAALRKATMWQLQSMFDKDAYMVLTTFADANGMLTYTVHGQIVRDSVLTEQRFAIAVHPDVNGASRYHIYITASVSTPRQPWAEVMHHVTLERFGDNKTVSDWKWQQAITKGIRTSQLIELNEYMNEQIKQFFVDLKTKSAEDKGGKVVSLVR
jgi:hypothetical protein